MDMADGTLPPASQVTVLQDTTSDDEGRALMQVVHEIARDATLMFYTALGTAQDFANGILALQQAGCNVIVDDVDDQQTDPMFQLGVVSEAVQQVISAGVIYVAAAGDSGANGYQAPWVPLTGTFTIPGGSTPFSVTDAENFGGSPFLSIPVTGSGGIGFSIAWDQPFTGPQSNMQVFVFSGGALVDDVPLTNVTNNGVTYALISGRLPTGNDEIVVEKASGPDPGLIKVILGHTPALVGSGAIVGANAGTIQGHSMTSGVIATGAADWTTTPAFSGSAVNEEFSASGVGTELLFDQNGNPLATPQVLSPVGVTGVDGMASAVYQKNFNGFKGTSAAAPMGAQSARTSSPARPRLPAPAMS
jgi:hypothetical protein